MKMVRPLGSLAEQWWHRLWPCYSCCKQVWIPEKAAFGAPCLGVVGHVPLWIAVLTVFLRYGLGPAWAVHRPIWLRRFAAEESSAAVLRPDSEAAGSPAAGAKIWTTWTMALALLSVGAALMGAFSAVLFPEDSQLHLAPVLPSIVVLLMLVLERPRTTPGAVFVIQATTFLTTLAIASFARGAYQDVKSLAVAAVGGAFLPLISLIVMLNMPMRDPLLDSTAISKPFSEPTYNARSPEDAITLWQWMSVTWMTPLIKIGYKRQLNDEDVWLLAYEFQHSRLHLLFRELTGSVFVRLLKANGLDLVITTSLSVLEAVIDLMEPVVLKQLLGALTGETPDTRAAITYAGLILFLQLVKAQSGIFNLWFCRRNYERARGEMITMIHEKTLRRKAFTFSHGDSAQKAEKASEQAQDGNSTSTTLADDESQTGSEAANAKPPSPPRQERVPTRLERVCRWLFPQIPDILFNPPADLDNENSPASTGKILNMLRGDLYEVAQRFWEAPGIVTKPLNLLLSIVLIWQILGPASVVGIVILVMGVAINKYIWRFILWLEKVRRRVTDVKLQRSSQLVESIRHLRWYDWQDHWLAQIMETRRDELAIRVISNIANKTMSTVNNIASYSYPVLAFLAYTLVSKKPLTVDIAFPALDLFGILQNNLREIPDLVTILLNARVAMGRIENFMLEPEKEDVDVTLSQESPQLDPPGELEVVLEGASFSWPEAATPVLNEATMTCHPGLTVVCGRVGIGKTALLQAVLGEMDHHGGKRSVPREMTGYCSQSPWLESMSIRDNILFCAPYDKTRFDRVIEACCLKEDFGKFRGGDLSHIGENGAGLSGGQKARVGLARALYSRARILLLDDPIAALDHQTATSILRNLFADKNCHLTAGRLIIFVTHRVDIVAPFASQILEIVEGGRVEILDAEALKSNTEDMEQLALATATSSSSVDGAERNGDDEDKQEEAPTRFIEEERRVHGGVLASVYWQYVKAGDLRWWCGLTFSTFVFRVWKIAHFWFLKEWGDRYEKEAPGAHSIHILGLSGDGQDLPHAVLSQGITHATTNSSSLVDIGKYLPHPAENPRPWLVWLAILSFFQIAVLTVSDINVIIIVYKAARNLFRDAMARVTNAKFRFYDVTPTGRLMNRLTSDMGTVDGQIANQIVEVVWQGMTWITAITVISTVTPVFLLISAGMAVLFVYTFDKFLPTSQSLRRLEMVSLSPLMTNLGTLVEGLTTVRAFRAEPHFQNRIIRTTDAFQKMDHIYWSQQAWLQFRFDTYSAVTTFVLTLTAIATRLSGGTIGFVLAAAGNFVSSTHSLCRRYGDLQMQFVSVERVVELLSLDQEPVGNMNPSAAWPLYGDDVVLDKVTLRYAPDLDPVFHDVSVTIPGGSSVAVTGRTGSGKSTLALSLLGVLHPEQGGSISIGGVDLANVNKHALRQKITFVAQDPVLFPGTLHDNLDPLREHDEAACTEVLERVMGRSGRFTLSSRVDGGGKNLSQGQRQLVGLARAVLRRSPIVIMDEATASIDKETAAYVHRLLREELQHSTVITIAHRVEAVEGANFELVMDKGRVIRAGPLRKRVSVGKDRGTSSKSSSSSASA